MTRTQMFREEFSALLKKYNMEMEVRLDCNYDWTYNASVNFYSYEYDSVAEQPQIIDIAYSEGTWTSENF